MASLVLEPQVLNPSIQQSEAENSDRYNELKAKLKESLGNKKPNVVWDSVVGLQVAKETILKSVAAVKFPLGPQTSNEPKGILLYGVSLKYVACLIFYSNGSVYVQVKFRGFLFTG